MARSTKASGAKERCMGKESCSLVMEKASLESFRTGCLGVLESDSGQTETTTKESTSKDTNRAQDSSSAKSKVGSMTASGKQAR